MTETKTPAAVEFRPEERRGDGRKDYAVWIDGQRRAVFVPFAFRKGYDLRDATLNWPLGGSPYSPNQGAYAEKQADFAALVDSLLLADAIPTLEEQSERRRRLEVARGAFVRAAKAKARQRVLESAAAEMFEVLEERDDKRAPVLAARLKLAITGAEAKIDEAFATEGSVELWEWHNHSSSPAFRAAIARGEEPANG